MEMLQQLLELHTLPLSFFFYCALLLSLIYYKTLTGFVGTVQVDINLSRISTTRTCLKHTLNRSIGGFRVIITNFD